MEELTRIADALERIADKLDMLAETGEEIEQDLNTLAECTGYIAPPVYAPAEANSGEGLFLGEVRRANRVPDAIWNSKVYRIFPVDSRTMCAFIEECADD